MRYAWLALALLSACASNAEEDTPEARARALLNAPVDGPSAARDPGDLDAWSGQEVTLVGFFDHDRSIHGVVVLASGLRVTIPHFDQYLRGDDWHKYVGHRCAATGILHTVSRNIDGYRGPSLKLLEFVGEEGE